MREDEQYARGTSARRWVLTQDDARFLRSLCPYGDARNALLERAAASTAGAQLDDDDAADLIELCAVLLSGAGIEGDLTANATGLRLERLIDYLSED